MHSSTNGCYARINLMNPGGNVDLGVQDVYCTNKVHAISYLYDSKEEIKTEISKYNKNALDIVKNTDVYEFNYKDVPKKKKTIGFVIGEKYKTADEIVGDENDGINSYSVMGLLWKAVQEQQELIEQMQKEIKELKEGK